MRRSEPLGLVLDTWRAASAPGAFFTALHDAPHAAIGRALGAAALSAVAATAVVALAFVRATASDGFVVIWGLMSAIALPYLGWIVLLGGLVMVRPANLDVRAWEIAAWAWAPAGVLAVSLAPAAWFTPVPMALFAVVALPIWHVTLIVHALRAFVPTRRAVPLVLYLAAVFIAPGLLVAVSYAVMQGMAAGS